MTAAGFFHRLTVDHDSIVRIDELDVLRPASIASWQANNNENKILTVDHDTIVWIDELDVLHPAVAHAVHQLHAAPAPLLHAIKVLKKQNKRWAGIIAGRQKWRWQAPCISSTPPHPRSCKRVLVTK